MVSKLTLYIPAILLCGGSLFCSVGLWVTEQNNMLAMILAGVFAGALELCKFAFFPVAASYWSQNQTKGAALYLLSFFLLFVSIVATVAFLETGSNATAKRAVTTSVTYQILQNDIASLERQINTINGLMEADLNHGYRDRAYSKGQELAALRAEKNQSIHQLANLKVLPTNGIHSIFTSLANQINGEVASVRQITYMLVAVLVDVCGIVCLLLLVTPATKRCKPLQQSETLSETEAAKPVSLGCNAATVRRNIVNGVYGNKPVMRNIIEAEGIRHPALQRLFETLIDEGFLEKVGNRVQLIAQPNEQQ